MSSAVGLCTKKSFPAKLLLCITSRAYVRPLALQRRQFNIHVGEGGWVKNSKPSSISKFKSQECDTGFWKWMREGSITRGEEKLKYYCVCSTNAVVLPRAPSPALHVRMLSCCRKSPLFPNNATTQKLQPINCSRSSRSTQQAPFQSPSYLMGGGDSHPTAIWTRQAGAGAGSRKPSKINEME